MNKMQKVNIIKAKAQITRLRESKAYFDSIHKNPLITLTCAGGCGYTHRVRLSRIRVGEVFICDRQTTRSQCRANMPRRGVQFHHQQAGAMAGVTWAPKPMKPVQPKAPQTFMGRLLGWLAG
ncbi:MAG: hypothetical protein ACRDC7_09220 [Aeromonas veronii]